MMENNQMEINNSLQLVDRLIYIFENLDNTNDAKAVYVDTLVLTLLNIKRLLPLDGYEGNVKADIQELKRRWGL
ncbi:hypothetical protein [Tissierella sp.]|uniref:hypothetical protein n=1 Tax=Tissierella sp. TaxID=41274 RepID=UPI0028A85316|nr:hypothetical protein [Tissierella sp.]